MERGEAYRYALKTCVQRREDWKGTHAMSRDALNHGARFPAAARALTLLFVAGCADPTAPLKVRIDAAEAEKKAMADQIEAVDAQHKATLETLEAQRHSNEMLRVELQGVRAQLEERDLRLAERSEMVDVSRRLAESAQQHLADMKSTHNGQSNLIERAKVYTAALKQELADRDRHIREKDRLIRDHMAEIEARDEEIALLKSSGAEPTEKRTGLAGPTPVGGGNVDRKIRRLGE